MIKATKIWVLIFLLFIPAINVHAGPIPDTGQTRCFSNTSEITCPQPGQAFYGQDGNYTINPPSYTKLDATGNALPDSAASWAIVRDNVTGLIWENKTNDGSIHDGTKTFTWCDTNSATNGGSQGTCGTGTGNAATDTEAFLKALNDAKFGGFSDRRLPTIKELAAILDRNRNHPTLNLAWFTLAETQYGSSYWSATANIAMSGLYSNYAWSATLHTGSSWNGSYKSNSFGVFAVRGKQATGGLIDNGDGTVTDTGSGLQWQQETQGTRNWESALAACENLSLAGYDDWRLPSINELTSIADYTRSNLAIDTTVFPGTKNIYWASSTLADPTGNAGAWTIVFDSGLNGGNLPKITDSHFARAVRGGQPRLAGHVFISAPAQGARWDIGTQQTITWDTAGLGGNVKIAISRQGGKAGTFTEMIAESASNNGSYAWTVTGPESFNCALQIEPVSDPAKRTTQGLFTAVAAPYNAWLSAEKLGDPAHYRITLYGRYSDGVIPISATFTTSDASVATVDQYGLLTAQKNGYVEVSTSYGGITYKKGLFVYKAFNSAVDKQEIEANGTKETANAVKKDLFYRGYFSDGDLDWFKLTLSAASLVDIGYLSYSATADVKAELFNSAGAFIASGTSANGQPLMFPLGLPAGDYYLKLSSAGDVDQTNYYVVTYREQGALPAKAPVAIAVGETKTGVINNLADITDFTFTLTAEQAVKILFSPTGGLSQYHLEVLNGSGQAIDRIDCLKHSTTAIEAIYPAGSYTLRVSPLVNVDAASPFTVQLTSSASQLENEPNDTYAQSTAFDITKPITGRLSTTADLDFYAFTLDTPRFLEVVFACPGAEKNAKLTLYKESDQNEIDGIDIVGGRTTSLHMGLGLGRYFLKVSSTDADTLHYYTLIIRDSSQTNLEIESNNNIKFANAMEKAAVKKARIYSSQDKDYFGFNLPADAFFTVGFTPATTTGDYKISLINENDTVLESFTSANGQAQSREIYQLPGNFYLRVEANGDIDQYKYYDLRIDSAAAITGLKQMVSVTVAGQQAQMTVGNTQTLTAKAGYSDATTTVVSPTWVSLNKAIATVDAAGQVTAVAQGTTSLVASYGGLTGKFDITVGAPANVVKQHYGNLILVAGGGIADTNTLKEATQYLSDLVYRRFKARLFADEDIYYFNPMPFHDINGDGYGENIVKDTSPTVAKFGLAITQWAAAQSTDGPLYIYLIDHGDLDSFQIFPGENLTAAQLKSYIDTFQAAKNRKVVVIIEACKSGSFTNDLVTSGQDRIVVTSTTDQYQLMSRLGTDSFTQFFVDKLWEGDSLYAAYTKARQRLSNMGIPYSGQSPQIGEGINLSSASVKIGGDFIMAGAMPEFIEQTTGKAVTANANQTLYAGLDSAVTQTIAKVWAVVIPPVYETTGTETQTVQFPTVNLTDPEKDGRYEGSYSTFTYNGEYRIVFYAQTTNGNAIVSPPTVFMVSGGLDLKSIQVVKAGAGRGSVTSQPAGIDCGTTCWKVYTVDTDVILTATADIGSAFTGWSDGLCSGTGTCNLRVNGAKSVTATFIDVYGDINGDGAATLTDAILVLQAASRLTLPDGVIRPDFAAADVNADGSIGLAEVIYILQKAAGMR